MEYVKCKMEYVKIYKHFMLEVQDGDTLLSRYFLVYELNMYCMRIGGYCGLWYCGSLLHCALLQVRTYT